VNVNYPKVGSRPGSANCSVVNSSGLIKNSRALSLKRPLSADSRLLKNFENLGKKFDDNEQSVSVLIKLFKEIYFFLFIYLNCFVCIYFEFVLFIINE